MPSITSGFDESKSVERSIHVCSTNSPSNFLNASTTRFTSYPGAGWLIFSTSSFVGASIFIIGLSTLRKAANTSGRCTLVALLSTLTLALG